MPLGANTQGHAIEPSLPLGLGNGLNVGSVQSLLRLLDFKLEAIAFFQVFVGHLTVMEEDIVLSIVRFDESISFGRAKPLDGSCLHNSVVVF